jgi:GT2 family glycosyltransferase
MPDCSIVIVSYNVQQYLVACLESLLVGCEGLSVEVLVVDNGSRDGTTEVVARRFPYVQLLVNAANLGFARAVNRALPLARGRYVLLLGPDTVVPPGALARVVKLADSAPRVGLVGPVLRDPVTGAVQSSFRPFPSWRTAFSHYTFAKAFLRLLPSPEWHPIVDQPTVAGWLSGACLLIRRELLDAVGGLDEGYFMWCEDIDYCRRAIRAGWLLFYTQETSVLHHGGKSADQERVSNVWLQRLQSSLHYLNGEIPDRSRLLKPVFKVAFLASVLCGVLKSVIKMVWYGTTGRANKFDKYRRRLGRDTGFLWRFVGRFLQI